MRKIIGQKGFEQSGQVTVEFAIVFAAFFAICLACGVLWHVLADGLFVEHALQSASHHMEAVVPGVIADVFLY
ncbi:MAG: hypothetical protein RR362_04755 [Raoultibacter sp.]